MAVGELLGMALGGLLAAVFFGLSGVLSKASTQAGVGIGIYIMLAGVGVVVVGAAFFFIQPDRTVSLRSALPSIGVGVTWALGAGLVALALMKYKVPLGKLVPLYNMNTLIAVLIALWLFSEWQRVEIVKLLIGAVLVIIGGTLVALS